MVGVGKWGVNLVRVLQDLDVEVETFDPFLGGTTSSINELFGSVDKVMVASPPETHFEYAAKAVLERKPLFVEKPLCIEYGGARWLRKVASSQVHVGHILLHAEGFQKHKAEQPREFKAWRAGHNPGYHGVTAWWDLAVHDIAAAIDLFGPPIQVETSISAESYEAWMLFANNRTAHIEGSRVHETKEWVLSFDGVEYSPYGEKVEPLRLEVEAFLDGHHNLESAVEVVKVLDQ